MDNNDEAEIRSRLEAGFDGRPTVDFATAARLLRMTEKTLRRHVRDGNVAFRAVGTGCARVRREFTPSDLTGFYARAKREGEGTPAAAGRRKFRPRPGLQGFLANVRD